MESARPAPIGNGGRIGPNAIWRYAEALAQQAGDATLGRVFAQAGIAQYLERLPRAMVDEREVSALHGCVRAELGAERAERVSRTAGAKTADYLLAHRIPRPAKWLLRRLPPAPASRMLLAAIGRHAWTFSGSGRFSARPGRPARITITDGPVSHGIRADLPVCAYYAATFERLFRELVDPNAVVTETDCEATGAPTCVFEIRW